MALIRRQAPSTYTMSAEERRRLARMTDEEVLLASQSDPDALPLTDPEIERLRAARVAQAARRRAGLSQAKFAKAYRIKVARLRDLEQGRRQPDPVLVSLLTLIGDDPERAARLLAERCRRPLSSPKDFGRRVPGVEGAPAVTISISSSVLLSYLQAKTGQTGTGAAASTSAALASADTARMSSYLDSSQTES